MEAIKRCDYKNHDLTSDGLEQAEGKEEDYIRCSRCDQQIVGEMYHCFSCSYYVHSDCMNLEKTVVNHPLHSHAALNLSLVEFNSECNCYGCPKKFKDSFLGYKCNECPRKLDLKCTLMDPNSINLHSHPLEFYYVNQQLQACNKKETMQVKVLIETVTGKNCAICELSLIGPINGCEPCDFWIHKTCRNNFQQEIKWPHNLHRSDHRLSFLSAPPFLNRCGACGKVVLRNTFHCKECNFDLHHGCAIRKPSLRHEIVGNIHNHDLIFFADPAAFFRCYSCKGFSYKTSIFRCVECDFNLHKACIKFPSTVKHKFHDCSLHFCDNFPIQNRVVCDKCGESVSPNSGAYTCSKCEFVVHLGCVLLTPGASNQEDEIKLVGKIVENEPLVGSKIEDRRQKNINHRIQKLQSEIEATLAKLKLEKKIVKEHGLINGHFIK
ncbi:unnamed protein product [Amaranthus hypochondriacus]